MNNFCEFLKKTSVFTWQQMVLMKEGKCTDVTWSILTGRCTYVTLANAQLNCHNQQHCELSLISKIPHRAVLYF